MGRRFTTVETAVLAVVKRKWRRRNPSAGKKVIMVCAGRARDARSTTMR